MDLPSGMRAEEVAALEQIAGGGAPGPIGAWLVSLGVARCSEQRYVLSARGKAILGGSRSLTKTERLVALVGSKAKTAHVINRHPAIVTRMMKAQVVPTHFNKPLMAWAIYAGKADEMVEVLEPCCDHCGTTLDLRAITR